MAVLACRHVPPMPSRPPRPGARVIAISDCHQRPSALHPPARFPWCLPVTQTTLPHPPFAQPLPGPPPGPPPAPKQLCSSLPHTSKGRTDYRPTPLVHYAFPKGGKGLYLVGGWVGGSSVGLRYSSVLRLRLRLGTLGSCSTSSSLPCSLQTWIPTPVAALHWLHLQLVDERGNFREDNFQKMRKVSRAIDRYQSVNHSSKKDKSRQMRRAIQTGCVAQLAGRAGVWPTERGAAGMRSTAPAFVAPFILKPALP